MSWDNCFIDELIGEDGLYVDGDWIESKDQDPNGEVRLIQLADIGDGAYLNKSARFLTTEKAKKLGCTFLKPDDILIARMPDPLGRACLFPGDKKPCVTVVDVCIVRPNKNKAETRWLLYAINSPRFRVSISGYISGTTRQRISRGNLSKIPLPLPPLAEQKRIAALLDEADSLRRKRREAIAKLDTLLQSVFLEMFGDPVTNPKGWEMATIGDLVQDVSYGTSSKANLDGAFPILRMGNITYSGRWNFADLKYIDLSESERMRYLVQEGEILFNRTNSKELVGKTAVYRCVKPMAFAGYLIRVRPNSANHSEYISAYLNSSHGKKVLLNMCKSIIGMANINATELKTIPIMSPPFRLQEQFASRVTEINAMREQQEQSLNRLETLFAALQQQAFGTSANGAIAEGLPTQPCLILDF